MILIGGTGLKQEDIPFSEMMDYSIENTPAILSIKLKTVAKGSSCLGVYLHSDLSNVELSEDVHAKTIFFNSDEHLIKLLESGGKEAEVKDTFTEDLKEQEQQQEVAVVFETPAAAEAPITSEPAPVVIAQQTSGGTPDFVVIEEVDTELPDTLLSIPNLTEDTDSMRWQVETKQRIIDQKDGAIRDMQQDMDDLYKLQEIQLLEMREAYEKRVDEANSIIGTLKQQVQESGIPKELQGFLKYAPYSQNFKAALREGFTDEELASLGKLNSTFYIFASGAGDSLHNMLKNVKALMDASPNALVVDFSNDYFMSGRYRIQSRESSMLLNDDSFVVESLVKEVNGARLIPTTFYNDIALLGFDWVKILKKLNLYAAGRPVILLFNNINSFSVRYTVSKLATVGQLSIFAKSNPVILSTLFGDIAFIPENRFKVVAMDYIDVVNQVLEQLSKKHQVVAFKDSIDWSKLGVKG